MVTMVTVALFLPAAGGEEVSSVSAALQAATVPHRHCRAGTALPGCFAAA